MFNPECIYLGGMVESPEYRICAEDRETIITCEGCTKFTSRKALCDVCEISKVCKKMSPPPAYFAPTRDKDKTYGDVKSFTATPVRHLIYHIWPNRNTDHWKWNIQHLLAYIDQFDGVRSIGVVLDQHTVDIESVKCEFGATRIDNWVCKTNDPSRRECVTFVPLMQTLPRGDNDITFYAHAKGVRHGETATTPLIWSHVQYRLCLEWPEIVQKHLQEWSITGCFKRRNEFRLPNHACWHYSGAFYWFRNYRVFERSEWLDVAPHFFAGVEAWPARIFDDAEAGILFGDEPGDLYDINNWYRLQPKLRELGIDIKL